MARRLFLVTCHLSLVTAEKYSLEDSRRRYRSRLWAYGDLQGGRRDARARRPAIHLGLPLEEELRAVLNDAARICAVEDAESRRLAQTVSANIGEVIVRNREVRMVEGIVELNADL
jgi:hypothetical protein